MTGLINIIVSIATFGLAHWQDILSAFMATLSATIAFFTIIPGPQPEKFLQQVVDFLTKFSRK